MEPAAHETPPAPEAKPRATGEDSSKLRRKTLGRKRRVLGWTLLAVGTLVAAIWAASGSWTFYYRRSTLTIYMSDGTVTSMRTMAGKAELDGFNVTRSDRGFRLFPEKAVRWHGIGAFRGAGGMSGYKFGFGYNSGSFTEVSPWPVPLVFWPVGAVLLRAGSLKRRRAANNQCPSCGYDRAGLKASASCPECGTTSPDATTAVAPSTKGAAQ